ncbi:UNVERIFIED_CONTAM: hypothetical protein FKN15_023072 [Acipenser sinensis]
MCSAPWELPSTVGSGIAWTRTGDLQAIGRILHSTRSAFYQMRHSGAPEHLIFEEKEKAKAQKEEVLTQMTEVLENELQCIVCSELFIEAVTLNCAHSFCSHCINQWRKLKDECPICRQNLFSQTRSLVLDNCIDRMVENLSSEMKERRESLIRERKAQPVAMVVINDDDNESSDFSSGSSIPSVISTEESSSSWVLDTSSSSDGFYII